MIQINSGRKFLEGRPGGIYDLLTRLPPGLMLDVGAGAGMTARLMLQKSPRSRVIAFEPFPGNYPHFERTLGGDPRVTLVKAAVAPEAGRGSLFVARTVTGSEPGWERMVGYSSAGVLVAADDERGAQSIPVETVRIDDVIGNEHVRFMKIDVQGGELGVLRSAERALSEARIDFMFVEYTGEPDLLDELLRLRMQLFDSQYMLIPRKPRSRLSWKALLLGTHRADLSNWDIEGRAKFSNGVEGLRAWPRSASHDRNDFCRFFEEERRKVGQLFTDLVAVSPHFVETFAMTAFAADGEIRPA